MVVKQTTRIDLNHHKLITYLMARAKTLRRLNTGYEIATIIILLSIVCTKNLKSKFNKEKQQPFLSRKSRITFLQPSDFIFLGLPILFST